MTTLAALKLAAQYLTEAPPDVQAEVVRAIAAGTPDHTSDTERIFAAVKHRAQCKSNKVMFDHAAAHPEELQHVAVRISISGVLINLVFTGDETEAKALFQRMAACLDQEIMRLDTEIAMLSEQGL
jgi:hypothetical protein